MHLQIDLLDAQINDRPDGSIEILGQSGYIVLKVQYAERIKAAHKQLLNAYPVEDSLKIVVNIEVPQPVGQIVNANDAGLDVDAERGGQNVMIGYDLYVDEP